MKKTLCVIFVSALLFSLSACNKTDLKDNNSSVTDKVYIEQTYKVETSEQNTTVETLPEVLSAEDKSVKAEIAKYSDTTVDFRNNKQEKIGKKDYDISFARVDSSNDYVVYSDQAYNEFKYNIKSGKLYSANILSAVTEKGIDSIDIDAAQKIAYGYASSKCNIDEYTLDLSKETDKEYEFSYRRYICGYKTADVLAVDVSFAGDIIYIIDNTDLFKNIEIQKININENWVNTKIDEWFSENGEDGTELKEDSVIITVTNNQPQLMFKVISGHAVGMCYIPIEIN